MCGCEAGLARSCKRNFMRFFFFIQNCDNMYAAFHFSSEYSCLSALCALNYTLLLDSPLTCPDVKV